jgi:hypothetical protein
MIILYVIGAGRSGSTILDIALGNHPIIESLGEFAKFPQNGWLNGEYCACGLPGNRCDFWRQVHDNWLAITAGSSIEKYIQYQGHYEHYFSWVRLILDAQRENQRLHEYVYQTQAFFESARNVSGCQVLVDSSKSPMRAYALSMLAGIDLYLIHLVRDVRGVAWSLRKPYAIDLSVGIQKEIKSRPPLRTGLFWTFVNLQSEWICSEMSPGRSLRVRYEDLVCNPSGTLSNIGDWMNLDLSTVIDKITQQIPLESHHAIAGNRLRMNPDIILQADQAWMTKMSQLDQLTSLIFSTWLMKRYGYW